MTSTPPGPAPSAGPTSGSTPGGAVRLTQFASGGGCACKVPPGELERVLSQVQLAGVPLGRAGGDLLVGLDDGDDGAVVRLDG
ncbi:MAG: selD, partial [Marmoricola sp.]|nr:selD [Marmoricola sp.]